MRDSAISWTVHTHNPWTGCTKVSPGCKNCYAAPIARRLGVEWGTHGERRRAAASTLRQPHAWNRKAEKEQQPAFVFCASMADLFDNQADPAWRAELFATIRATPWLTWQLLTKRPQNIRKMLPPDWGEGYPNVWLGTSAEDQAEAERRLPVLLEVPARVRFVSAEPLLEKISLEPWLGPDKVSWVIVGCEAIRGGLGRPFSPDWARALRDECTAAGVAFFYKQEIGVSGKKVETPLLDGRRWTDRPEPALPVTADLPVRVQPSAVVVDGLAERLNAAHRALEHAVREVVARGVEFGELLIEAKAEVGHGGWAAWVEANCAFSIRHAQNFMLLARELPRLPPEEAQRVAHLSLREAMGVVSRNARGLRALPAPVRQDVLDAASDEALRGPLSRAAVAERYKAKPAAPPASPPPVPTEPASSVPAPSPRPAADPELASAIMALCRDHAARNPKLTATAVCETLNAVYIEVQDGGLVEVEDLAA